MLSLQSSHSSFTDLVLTQGLSWWCMHWPRWMSARILGGGRNIPRHHGISFWPFPNSSSWWWFVSSMFLTRTSCHKITCTNGYYDAWPGWALSVSLVPLTKTKSSVVWNERPNLTPRNFIETENRSPNTWVKNNLLLKYQVVDMRGA